MQKHALKSDIRVGPSCHGVTPDSDEDNMIPNPETSEESKQQHEHHLLRYHAVVLQYEGVEC